MADQTEREALIKVIYDIRWGRIRGGIVSDADFADALIEEGFHLTPAPVDRASVTLTLAEMPWREFETGEVVDAVLDAIEGVRRG